MTTGYKVTFIDGVETKTVYLAIETADDGVVARKARQNEDVGPDAKLLKVETLTPRSDAQYRLESHHCPICLSGEIEGHDIEVECNEAWQEIVCLRCGYEWHDIYEMKGYSGRQCDEPDGKPLDVPGNFAGRTIMAVRNLTKEELAREGWGNKETTCLVLDNGTIIYPSRDYEGYGDGQLFVSDGKEQCLIRAKPSSPAE